MEQTFNQALLTFQDELYNTSQDYWDKFVACAQNYDKDSHEYDTCIYNAYTAVYNDTYDYIDKQISSQVQSIAGSTINNLINGFGDFIDESVSGVFDYVGSILNNIGDFFVEMYQGVMSSLEGLVQTLWSKIESAISGLEDIIDSILNSVTDIIDEAIYIIKDFAAGVWNSVEQTVSDAWNYLEDIYYSVSDKISEMYTVTIDWIESLYVEFEEWVIDFSSDAMSYLEGLYDAVYERITELVDFTTEIVGEYISIFGEFAVDVVGGLAELVASIKDNIADPLQAVANAALYTFGIVENEENKSIAGQTHDSIMRVYDQIAKDVSGKINLESAYKDSGILESVFGHILVLVVDVVATALAYWQGASVSNNARSQKLLYDVMSLNPVKDFTESEAAGLLSRGFINENEAADAALKQGYTNEKFNKLANASYTPIDPQRTNEARNRGIMDQSAYTEMLQRQGYKKEDINTIDQLRNIIPPVQDLITMAVREVFSPAIAERFQLFEQFPEEFGEQAVKHGLSEEWAKRYWGAHWRLPSANQGFEMYHRKVISYEDLEMLLKALDVMPFWRDKLVQIAYQPITRVDIRRIFKLGLIDAEEVKSRLQDIGYSPDDSVLMTEFYKVYVGDTEEEDYIDPKDLTRAQIKNLWSLGTITESDAISRMIDIGYSSDMAEILVNSWGDAEAVKERESMINRYAKKAIREGMTDQQVEKLFYDLNLTKEEMIKIKKYISLELHDKTAIPSKTELKNMYFSGIISQEQWIVFMRMHGYNDSIIEYYHKLYFGV